MRPVKETLKLIPALGVAFLLCACGFSFEGREKLPKFKAQIEELNEEEAPYYNYRSETFHRKDPRLVGRVSITPAIGSSLEGVKLELRKIPKGYAAETRLFEEKSMQGNFTVAREKESKFVAGFYLKYKF